MAISHFQERWVLITGAASGIGLSCARAFAAEGASLVLSDVNAAALDAAAAEITAMGARCIALPCDVSSHEDTQAFAAAVLAQVKTIDVLINNAGIGYIGGFMDTPVDAWRRIVDINLLGVVNVTRAFLPAMRADGTSKAIVNIASTAGFAPAPSMSAYGASKFAVVGLSEVLAMELDDTPITVTVVAPGVINTDIVKVRRNMAPTISDDQLDRLQAYYDRKGCDPSVVARDIVRAVRSGTALLKTGPYARLMCTLARLSRPLTRRLSIISARTIGYL